MSPTNFDQSPRSSRRGFIRLLGVAGGTAAAGVGSQAADFSPVQNGRAIAPVVVAGAVGASVAAGWLLRETEVLGSDEPPEGLTAPALKADILKTVRRRKSNNQSTIVDNKNIVEGVKQTAWSDGKIAAVEALNNQETEEKVLNKGMSAVREYEKTVKKNYLKSWNESLEELEGMLKKLGDHGDAGRGMFGDTFNLSVNDHAQKNYHSDGPPTVVKDAHTATFTDGTEFTVHKIKIPTEHNYQTIVDSSSMSFSMLNRSSGMGDVDWNGGVKASYTDDAGNTYEETYMIYQSWKSVWDTMVDSFNQVLDGLGTWVSKVYGQVQSGELDTSELLTARERAQLVSDDEGSPQALADLEALNVAVDYKREATIRLPDRGATLSGRLSITGDAKITVGEVDPNATDKDGNPIYGSVYFTYDTSEGSGDWSAYETGLNGGVLTFTSEPYEKTVYTVRTVAGETVDVPASDFTHDEENDVYTTDLSGDLDTAITDVEYVEYEASSDETNYETVRLKDPFEVVTFTNTETGEESDESNFERSDPHTDDNYISEEEWKKEQEKYEELIEKYEDAQGGGGVDLSQFDMFGIPGEVVALIAAGLAVLGISN